MEYNRISSRIKFNTMLQNRNTTKYNIFYNIYNILVCTCILDQSLTDILTTFEPQNTGNTGKMCLHCVKIQEKIIKKQLRPLFLQHVPP